MPLDLNAGTQTASGPSRFSALERTAQIARELAGRSGLTDLSAPASLDLRFADQFGYRKNAVTDGAETFEGRLDMLATISRASLAYNPNWSFRSGDAVGRLEEVAANVLRYNQPPNTAGGRLLETAAATKLGRNPRFEGATVGALDSGGALPQYMSITGIADSAVTVVGVSVVNGWPRLRITLNGTPSSAPRLIFEEDDQIAGVNTNTFCHAVGLALAGGSLTNLSSIGVRIAERTAAGADVAAGSNNVTPDSAHRRYYYGRTLSGGGTVAKVTHEVIFNWSSGAINVTLDIFVPEIETGLVPTSPMLPVVDTPATATRAAETVTEGVTFTRPSRAYAMDWDGTSGGRVGPLKEFLQNTARQGEWGLWLTPFSVVNKIRNPRGVAGTGATPPTHWTNIGSGGLSRSYTRGTENGMDYVDIAFSGTQVSASALGFEIATQIAAVTGDKVTTAMGARIVAGSYAGNVKLAHYEMTSGGATVASRQSAALAVDRQPRWFFFRDTLAGGGTTAYVWPSVYLDGYTGSVSFTLRVYIPQCTKTAFPCLPVLPEPGVTAESTQAAEACEIANGGWSNDNGAGTLFAEFVPLGIPSSGLPRLFSYGAGSNYASAYFNGAGGQLVAYGENGFVTQWNAPLVLVSPAEVCRVAESWAVNDVHAVVNGTSADDASASINFGTSKIRLGDIPGGGNASTVPLLFKSIRYFPAALPDAEVDILGAAS